MARNLKKFTDKSIESVLPGLKSVSQDDTYTFEVNAVEFITGAVKKELAKHSFYKEYKDVKLDLNNLSITPSTIIRIKVKRQD